MCYILSFHQLLAFFVWWKKVFGQLMFPIFFCFHKDSTYLNVHDTFEGILRFLYIFCASTCQDMSGHVRTCQDMPVIGQIGLDWAIFSTIAEQNNLVKACGALLDWSFQSCFIRVGSVAHSIAHWPGAQSDIDILWVSPMCNDTKNPIFAATAVVDAITGKRLPSCGQHWLSSIMHKLSHNLHYHF